MAWCGAVWSGSEPSVRQGEWAVRREEPAEVLLEQPDFRDACARRDFRVVFTQAHEAGWSYNRIADACALPSERVSKIARGQSSIRAMETIERIADGLQLPGALLGPV